MVIGRLRSDDIYNMVQCLFSDTFSVCVCAKLKHKVTYTHNHRLLSIQTPIIVAQHWRPRPACCMWSCTLLQTSSKPSRHRWERLSISTFQTIGWVLTSATSQKWKMKISMRPYRFKDYSLLSSVLTMLVVLVSLLYIITRFLGPSLLFLSSCWPMCTLYHQGHILSLAFLQSNYLPCSETLCPHLLIRAITLRPRGAAKQVLLPFLRWSPCTWASLWTFWMPGNLTKQPGLPWPTHCSHPIFKLRPKSSSGKYRPSTKWWVD